MSRTARTDSNVVDDDSELSRVEVDALVIMQIMKHCRQQALHSPLPVTGMLLGLDVNEALQVTHCFGYPLKQSDQDQAQTEEAGEDYQINMLKRLREVNVDSNTVGWYQSTSLGNFFNDTLIETQYQYQETIPRSIILVYDQYQSQIGKPSFKALRLTREFMDRYKETKESNKAALNEFPSSSMFVEIPITITSAVIAEAFLVDWAIADPSSCTQIETLDVENQVQERNVQLLINSLHDLAEEQLKMQQYERQASRQHDPKSQGKGRQFRVQQPRQLDTMILSQQIQNYCKQINNSAEDTFGKVFLLANNPASGASS